VIELGFPLIQERDDFVKFRLLPEKHLPHLLVPKAQFADPGTIGQTRDPMVSSSHPCRTYLWRAAASAMNSNW